MKIIYVDKKMKVIGRRNTDKRQMSWSGSLTVSITKAELTAWLGPTIWDVSDCERHPALKMRGGKFRTGRQLILRGIIKEDSFSIAVFTNKSSLPKNQIKSPWAIKETLTKFNPNPKFFLFLLNLIFNFFLYSCSGNTSETIQPDKSNEFKIENNKVKINIEKQKNKIGIILIKILIYYRLLKVKK